MGRRILVGKEAETFIQQYILIITTTKSYPRSGACHSHILHPPNYHNWGLDNSHISLHRYLRTHLIGHDFEMPLLISEGVPECMSSLSYESIYKHFWSKKENEYKIILQYLHLHNPNHGVSCNSMQSNNQKMATHLI